MSKLSKTMGHFGEGYIRKGGQNPDESQIKERPAHPSSMSHRDPELVVGKCNFMPKDTFGRPRDTRLPVDMTPEIPGVHYLQVLHWKHNAVGFQVYRQSKDIPLPEFATADAAAFDLYFSSNGKKRFTVYSPDEPKAVERNFEHDGGIFLKPRERAMVPTGLHFNIMPGYYVEIWPRSGTALKQGLKLANGVGIIDSDYKEEVFILIEAGQAVKISNRSRIAQGQLKKIDPPHVIMEIGFMPQRTTERQGGFGSTGVENQIKTNDTEWVRLVPRYPTPDSLDIDKELQYNRDK